VTSCDSVENAARFVSEHVDEILAECPGGAPQRHEAVARMTSLLVGRYHLREPSFFWEELDRTPFGICAALDAFDVLERCVLRVIRRRLGDTHRALDVVRGLERSLDELRSDCVQLARQSGRALVIDAGTLDHLPAPLFTVSIAREVSGVNAAGRALLTERRAGRCYEAFLGRTAQCEPCPLESALATTAPRRCPPPAGAPDAWVELAPITPDSALAYFGPSDRQTRRRIEHHAQRNSADLGEQVGAGLLESIGSGVMFVDREQRIAFANTVATELFGGDVIGANLAEFLPGADAIDDERQHKVRIRLGGRELLLGYRCMPCSLEGTPGRVISVRDITEIERMRSEMDKMKRLSEIGRMCAVVAHEIRNPLAGIMATIQSIEEEAIAAGLDQPLATVQHEVTRLSELLSGFFAFVRYRPPRRRMTDIRALVDGVLRSAAPRLAEIHHLVDVDVEERVWVDPDQLHQALLNLVINAADAVGESGTIRLRACVEADRLEIDVIDDGCGIPRDQLDSVFDAFYTTKAGGTGLGLSISYRIANAHGGAIHIDSAHGIGTRVHIAVPAFEPPPGESHATEETSDCRR